MFVNIWCATQTHDVISKRCGRCLQDMYRSSQNADGTSAACARAELQLEDVDEKLLG